MSTKPAGWSVDLGQGDPLQVTGWDALEDMENASAEQLQAQVDHASLYRQCFATTAGRYVLEDLIQMFKLQRIVEPGDTNVIAAAGVRQGQCDVVDRILKMIEFANTGGGKLTGAGIIQEE